MFKRAVICVALVFACGALDLAAQEDDMRPGIAVFPFENGGSYGPDAADLEPLTVGLQQMLLTELQQHAGLRIVERNEMARILEELDLSETDRMDAATAAEIGKLVGARYAIAGSFTDWYGDFRLDTRIFSVETSEIVKAEMVQDERANMYRILVDMASQIMADVELEPLQAEVTEARRGRDVPPEAVTLFARAQVFQDDGNTDRAIELYRRITETFPDYTEAQDELNRISGDDQDAGPD
jgi:TolB-like protein